MKVLELLRQEDKVAIVMGGSMGIGKQLALGLAGVRAHMAIEVRPIERCDDIKSVDRGKAMRLVLGYCQGNRGPAKGFNHPGWGRS